MPAYPELATTKIDLRQLALIGRLGAGGLALLHEARDADGKRVVLRQLRWEHKFSLKLRRCFAQGVETRRLLGAHPCIVQYFGEGGTLQPYEVIEFVPGDNLKALITQRHRSVVQFRYDLLLAAGIALVHVHQVGFLHLDIKPENFLVRLGAESWELKLTDFDLATPITETKAPRWFGGSLMFLAPEFLARKEISVGADYFAFGVLAYNLVTGQLPFVNSVENAIQNGRVNLRFPSDQGLAIPVREFITRCLAFAPEERYTSDRRFLRDLANIQRLLGTPDAGRQLPTVFSPGGPPTTPEG